MITLSNENKRIQNLNRVRFIKFCIVGTIGIIPNYVIYTILKNIELHIFDIVYINVGWALGIAGGMCTNYILNELWTWD